MTTSFGLVHTNFTLSSDVGWDQNAQGIKFAGIATTLTLGGGKNYDGGTDPDASGAFQVTLVD